MNIIANDAIVQVCILHFIRAITPYLVFGCMGFVCAVLQHFLVRFIEKFEETEQKPRNFLLQGTMNE